MICDLLGVCRTPFSWFFCTNRRRRLVLGLRCLNHLYDSAVSMSRLLQMPFIAYEGRDGWQLIQMTRGQRVTDDLRARALGGLGKGLASERFRQCFILELRSSDVDTYPFAWPEGQHNESSCADQRHSVVSVANAVCGSEHTSQQRKNAYLNLRPRSTAVPVFVLQFR